MSSRRRSNQRNRRAAFPKSRRRGGNALKFLLIPFLVLLLSCYAVERLEIDSFFTIKAVAVDKTEFIPAAYLDSLCQKLFMGRSILSRFSKQKGVIEAEPMVRQVRLSRRFPDRLFVRIEERQPVALVNASELLPVDSDGFILPIDLSGRRLDLPILSLPSSSGARRGAQGRLSKDGLLLLEALETFRRAAPELLPLISEFTLDERGKVTVVTVNDGIQVVMGKWITRDNLRYLNWMLGELKLRGEKPTMIDLSYEGQIIVKNGRGI